MSRRFVRARSELCVPVPVRVLVGTAVGVSLVPTLPTLVVHVFVRVRRRSVPMPMLMRGVRPVFVGTWLCVSVLTMLTMTPAAMCRVGMAMLTPVPTVGVFVEIRESDHVDRQP